MIKLSKTVDWHILHFTINTRLLESNRETIIIFGYGVLTNNVIAKGGGRRELLIWDLKYIIRMTV